MARQFIAAITASVNYTLPNLGTGNWYISAIGGGQAGEDGSYNGGLLGYFRGGTGGTFATKNIGFASGSILNITIGAGGLSNFSAGGDTIVIKNGVLSVVAPGGGSSSSPIADTYNIGGYSPIPVTATFFYEGGFTNFGPTGGAGMGGGGAGGPLQAGGLASNLGAFVSAPSVSYAGSLSGGGGGGEFTNASGTNLPLLLPTAPNFAWQQLGLTTTKLGYGGGGFFELGGPVGGSTFDGFTDGSNHASGGGAGGAVAYYPNVTPPFSLMYKPAFWAAGGDGAPGTYWQSQYGPGGGGGGGAGIIDAPWLASYDAALGIAGGGSGGDGGLYGGGGGAGASGAPSTNLKGDGVGINGLGGKGAQGIVIIEFEAVSVQYQAPNLIPLPWPRYARTPRGLFYPWGLKK